MEIADIVGLAGIPVIVALVQACKPWVKREEWWPILAIAWGLAINLFAAYALEGDWKKALVYALVAGLGASGLYSGGRTVARI